MLTLYLVQNNENIVIFRLRILVFGNRVRDLLRLLPFFLRSGLFRIVVHGQSAVESHWPLRKICTSGPC